MKPGERGISLSLEEWGTLSQSTSIVDEKMLLLATVDQFIEHYIDALMGEALDAFVLEDTESEVRYHWYI